MLSPFRTLSLPARAVSARARLRVSGALALSGSLLSGLVVGAAPAEAYPGAAWFEPSKVYTQNFPDPSVLQVGDTYYAYSTPTGGAYLPVMTSKDLVTWTARAAYDPGAPLNRDPYFNDALPYPARWGGDWGSGRMTKQIWAPGVERFGDHYILFYSVRMPNSDRFCLSTARATSPLGPFTDNSPGPLHCDTDPNGSIDPEPFYDPATGKAYLIWKSEGVPGSQPTKMWSRELGPDGWSFAAGSSAREILRTSQGWEGNVIESPSMVAHQGQLYLFYSANEWNSDRYASSYALCESPLGPCHKPRSTPLIASNGSRLGPGGPSAFVDGANQLRVMYHYWNAPYTSYPAYPQCESNKSCQSQGQRRMTNVRINGSGAGLVPAGEGALAPPWSGPVATARPTGGACPAGVPDAPYSDMPEGAAHESAVDCVSWWGVAQGAGGGRYNPAGSVTRAQMASFLARAILNSGGSLPEGRDAFSDDQGNVHEAAINRLAAAGIVKGTGSGYDPNGIVSREQMATFLVRAQQHRTGRSGASNQNWFYDDDGSAHEAAINSAAAAGLATGTGTGMYSPRNPVRRDQMASFLSRLLQTYVEAGASTPR